MPSAPLHDIAFGLRCVAGNESLYRKLLGKFLDQQAHTATRVEEALDQGDMELAHRLAHTLKGVASSLGLREAERVAAEMDAAFKAGQDVRPMLPVLAACLEETVAVVTAYCAG